MNKFVSGHIGKIVAGIILAVAAFLIWHFFKPIENFSKSLPTILQNASTTPVVSQLQNLQQQIFAPPPLTGGGPTGQSADLTQSGVIAWTNNQRRENGNLPALKENSQLDRAAANKLADMFKQQYFEHVNPQGKGPAEVDKAVGYLYVSIGENLALGYFDGDQGLLEAWMNSPGHRANILNKKYQEIGVAVGKGLYQGNQTWLAVQEFGQPQSSCPIVDTSLKAQIDGLSAQTDQLLSQLNAEKQQMAAEKPQTQTDYDAYNKQVADFNSLVEIYNNKIDVLKLDTSQYNGEVEAFNACLGS